VSTIKALMGNEVYEALSFSVFSAFFFFFFAVYSLLYHYGVTYHMGQNVCRMRRGDRLFYYLSSDGVEMV
jgi:hypothetical protein